ncbi:hypothetical protein [Arcobacter sp. F2176]|uniref:hypothetical protein n=1 Tax=Arcobacter sp. F2176 TaxID=2044511 RepID=UPI00100A37D4|nr:hypothetical protein [Arcobacter sp. F2176]RXJ80469.1 hypothetical protein CRU95_10825 [Arcobacter sp. F2176]
MSNKGLYEKLCDDIKFSIKDEFNNYDSDIDETKHFKNVMFDYINWRKRFIKLKSRRVVYSYEIKQNPHYRIYKKGIEKIAYKIKQGEDITSFLSTKVVHAPYKENSKSSSPDKDNFLNAFDIHHLHMGSTYKDKDIKGVKFAERSNGMLLFILVKHDVVYFIDIEGHNFGNLKLFRIIKKNWEHLVKPYKMSYSINDMAIKNLSDEDIEALLQAGVNPTVPIDNEVYGFSHIITSGHSMNIHREIDTFALHLNKVCTVLLLDEHLRQQLNNPDYKMVVSNGLLYLVDNDSKCTIWIDHKLEEKEILNEYCYKKAHLFDFNF